MAWLIIPLAYVLGSVPTAYVAGRLLRVGDIRLLGDGNVGARNAFLEIGSAAGIAVFAIDAVKGLVPVLVARGAALPDAAVLGTGMAAVIGHNWPALLGFRGGRGEATTIGVLSALVAGPLLVTATPALAVLLVRRSAILASCVLFIPLPLVCWWQGVAGVAVAGSLVLPTLVGLTHYLRTRRPFETWLPRLG